MIPLKKMPSRQSLRWILALWFLTFAIVPVIFLTFYSLRKFQQTIDNELVLRLRGNASEISVILTEYQRAMVQQHQDWKDHRGLQQFLIQGDVRRLQSLTDSWLSESSASSLSLYSSSGQLLVENHKSPRAPLPSDQKSHPAGRKKVTLHSPLMEQLLEQEFLFLPDYSYPGLLDLTVISTVRQNKRTIGYLKQSLMLNEVFLKRLSERMQIEALLLEPNGRTIVGSHPDFALYKPDFFSPFLKVPNLKTIALTIRGEPFGFIFYQLPWGPSSFTISLAASKKDSNQAIANLRVAYYSLLAIMLTVLALSVLAASHLVLRPLSELVEAIQDLHLGENIIELPVKSNNEIGQLTTSFNDLSRRIMGAQRELKLKIKELEETNSHLKETQAQLVQSAKMASLGQLVAGVAHELNNPIGFIYSNMAHLREYSEKLLLLADQVEGESPQIQALKKEIDLDFIRKDLPKLIASCEDGARRTKEIVIGLRNFSRIEEKSHKPVDIHQSIDTTLNLLSSEIKNRIEVHKDYGLIPPVIGNQTQLNQVLMNILSNAAQAIENKGSLWITTKRMIDPQNQLDQISIAIQDSGPGVPPEHLPKIFDPFFTTKGVGKGTGLGLAISYGIIQDHGGTISVNSELGAGTEFIITLPIEPHPIPKKDS